MALRQDLHDILVALPGVTKVYFQPPVNVQLVYPCIVYKRDSGFTRHADNQPYTRYLRYQVTVIDRNPDSAIPSEVAQLPSCEFDRFYTADDLNHDVFTLFF